MLYRSGLVLLVILSLVFVHRGANANDTITPSPNLPESQPWNLSKLSKAPEFEWIDAEGPVRSLMYQGEAFEGHPTRVFAYYATPGTVSGDKSRDKDLPAIVCLHGGGGTAFREWAELWAKRGYAAIAMDLAGARPNEGTNPHQQQNRTRLTDGGPNQGDEHKFRRISDDVQNQWQYHAVANALLAHSLIRSFPEVDPTRTGVTGISWGGYLTCIVAGVDSRFHAAVPVYGCGFLTDNSKWLDQFARMTPEQKQRWHTLWDPSRYLPAVTMPILFVNGTNDFAYPLDSYMKSYRAVPDNVFKQLAVTVKMPHSHPAGWNPPVIGRFMDQQLKKGAKLPTLGKPVTGKEEVRVMIDGTGVKSAAIHWAVDDKVINAHDWITKPAKIESGKVTAELPPADAKVWFVTAEMEDGSVISSVIEIASPAK